MRKFIGLTPKLKTNPAMNYFFSAISHDIGFAYKNYSSRPKATTPPLVELDIIKKASEDVLATLCKLEKASHKKKFRLNLFDSQVIQFAEEDIELNEEDKIAKVALAAGDDFDILYGDRGIAASETRLPEDLLKYELPIPRGSVGVLKILKHVPFLIKARSSDNIYLASDDTFVPVLAHHQNIKRHLLTQVIELPQETSKIVALRLQQAILENKNNEYFYEEITSRVYQPSIHTRSSGTLMSFDQATPSDRNTKPANKATANHYHPGERSLYIFTTYKPAGVILNFCGIAESPDARKDCEVEIKFPKNSLSVINFPSFTHHRFHGEFVCISIHPREGNNLIEALLSGTLSSRGFLENATTFSKTLEDVIKTESDLYPNTTLKDAVAEPLSSEILQRVQKT